MLAQHWDKIRAYDFRWRWGAMSVSLAIVAGHFLMRAAGWQMTTRLLGCALPLRRSIPIWFVSYAGRYIPGKIWIFTIRIVTYRAAGCAVPRVALATVIDTLLDNYAGFLVGVTTLLWLPRLPLAWKAAGLGVALAGGALLIHPYFFNLAVRIVQRRRSAPDTESGAAAIRLTARQLATLGLTYAGSYLPYTLAYCALRCAV